MNFLDGIESGCLVIRNGEIVPAGQACDDDA